MASIMQPREAAKFISQHSKDVSIDPEGVQNTAKKVCSKSQLLFYRDQRPVTWSLQLLDILRKDPESLHVSRWNLHDLNPKTADAAALDWCGSVHCLLLEMFNCYQEYFCATPGCLSQMSWTSLSGLKMKQRSTQLTMEGRSGLATGRSALLWTELWMWVLPNSSLFLLDTSHAACRFLAGGNSDHICWVLCFHHNGADAKNFPIRLTISNSNDRGTTEQSAWGWQSSQWGTMK